ncbi:hypothetical protein TNIN_16371 [Trichonephila inaurata madagascariensis]|uniref:Uncharacterized protein n=1 Tax=Trichonephila inaurata madagascariensis TaxID=2747483 RepID=A0A8X6XHC3_9ARAC|nr:hypothetical protein TNIN_16371 [Trichonephila inaurata madagascariensis]
MRLQQEQTGSIMCLQHEQAGLAKGIEEELPRFARWLQQKEAEMAVCLQNEQVETEIHLQLYQASPSILLQLSEAETKVPFAQVHADLTRWIEELVVPQEQAGSVMSLMQKQIGTEIHIQQNQALSNQSVCSRSK